MAKMLKFNHTSELSHEVASAISEVIEVDCYVKGTEWDDEDLVCDIATCGKPLVSVKFKLTIPERTIRLMFSDGMPERM